MNFRTFLLTLSWRSSLSYGNQSTDLLCKSMDWLLYDSDIRHERLNCIWYDINGYSPKYFVSIFNRAHRTTYSTSTRMFLKCCNVFSTLPFLLDVKNNDQRSSLRELSVLCKNSGTGWDILLILLIHFTLESQADSSKLTLLMII